MIYNKILAALLAVLISTPALAWGDREQGILAGITAVLLWQKLDAAAENNRKDRTGPQQFPTYQPQPQFIPQQQMPIPTGFQEPCQFRGHHARIYDRYGQPIAIRVCE